MEKPIKIPKEDRIEIGIMIEYSELMKKHIFHRIFKKLNDIFIQ